MTMQKNKFLYGLVGYPLKHSLSPSFFQKKFFEEKINAEYKLFEIDKISKINDIIKQNKNLKGFNVTIPYKEKILNYINYLDEKARKISAVNTVKIEPTEQLIGFNTDYYAFKKSLENFLLNSSSANYTAIVFGYGGAAKAVVLALKDLNIDFIIVSRKNKKFLNYNNLNEEIIKKNKLLINTTPVGMYPSINEKLKIPFNAIGKEHLLYDLIYNPPLTVFLKEGLKRGAKIKNGEEMLYLQAELSWSIWQKKI